MDGIGTRVVALVRNAVHHHGRKRLREMYMCLEMNPPKRK